MITRLGKLITIAIAIVALGLTALLVSGYQASAHESRFQAQLRDAYGQRVGTVDFRIGRHAMTVDAEFQWNQNVTPNQFHGFHVHANNDLANGEGCIANPDEPRNTWFVSADGHLSATGLTHGAHQGDLPSPLIGQDGTARLRFTTDRLDPELLRGRVVILHANPDNFGNVPTGTASAQYSPNTAAATDLTDRTGNAGDRMACGVIRRSR
ncbi:MAG TPA: superoxide dismutase family protein [Microlunatus sp.]|nr:superoxide dismutase family protein [Microlunatus sp.]